MRNKMTITLTDIHGSNHYTVSQLIKKILLYFVLGIVAFIVLSTTAIYYLNFEVGKRNRTITDLEKKRQKTEQQYEMLQAKLQQKSKTLESMESKINDIEERIGLKPLPEMTVQKRIDVAALDTKKRHAILQMIPSGYPVPYKGVTSKYGWRTNPVMHKREFHPGIDLRAKWGTPIHAPADAVVEFAAKDARSGYGKLLILDHNYGFRTLYGHLSRFKVKRGDVVKKGEIVAYTGNTGLSNGPHLHYEIRYLQLTLNPYYFIKWNMGHFNYIFDKEKRIQWDSLIKLIESQNASL
jgi:murein DD-endopeptidase MepM/ murein hydrolase activator NlpD